MPLRYNPTGAALFAQKKLSIRLAAASSSPPPWLNNPPHHHHCPFHSSRPLRLETNITPQNPANHYDTLNINPDASPAEIKKSFYHLSKRHHPDHNPSDPSAPTRFMHISEAYATLAHPDKRARYDRDVMRPFLHRNPHYHHHHAPGKGSWHSSTGPAGGRPASGLSRRRGTYQGPPPSFYRSGGWGAHGTKRRQAHEESTGTGKGFGTDSQSGSQAGGADAGPPPPPPPPPPPGGTGAGGMGGGGFGRTGGMGPGQDPFGHHDDVPHFDRAAHERAQRRGDDRRAHQMAKKRGVNIDEFERATTVSFFGVMAILAAAVSGSFALTGLIGWGNLGSNGNGGKGREKDKERERERERERNSKS